MGLDGLGIVLPQPAHGLGEDGGAVILVVAVGAPDVLHFVAGPLEGPVHGLVGHPPVAGVDVEILVSVLEEDAERFRFGFADEGGQFVAAAEADIGSDHGIDTAERIRPVPGGHEGADSAGAGTADSSVVGIAADLDAVRRFDEGDHLFDEEPGIAIADVVVFKGAVEPRQASSLAAGTTPGLMNSPTRGGIAPSWIRLSKTIGPGPRCRCNSLPS